MAEKTSAGTGKYWVLAQHDQFTVTQGDSPPSTAIEPGERQKRAHGPYPDQASADAALKRMKARTWPEIKKGMGY